MTNDKKTKRKLIFGEREKLDNDSYSHALMGCIDDQLKQLAAIKVVLEGSMKIRDDDSRRSVIESAVSYYTKLTENDYYKLSTFQEVLYDLAEGAGVLEKEE